MKPPPRTLKRKRSFGQDEEASPKNLKSTTTNGKEPLVTPIESKNRPSWYSTSDTSGLSSADEHMTINPTVGARLDVGKHVLEHRRPSEISRTADVVGAYKSAIEILMEIANRERRRAYSVPHVGYGSPAIYSSFHPQTPMNHYAVPFATPPPSAYATPYANPEPPRYVTPYTNAPAIGANVTDPCGGNQPVAVTNAAVSGNAGNGRAISNVLEDVSKVPNGGGRKADEPRRPSENEGSPSVSVGLLDGFLALANGGVLPGQKTEAPNSAPHGQGLFAPPSPGDTIDNSMSRLDDDVLAHVDRIVNDLMNTQEPPAQANPYAPFFSLMSSRQLGAELKRLVDIVQPEVNAIKPREQIQAMNLFYTHLLTCIHARNAASTRTVHPPAIGPPPPFNQWGPAAFPPPPPSGYMLAPAPGPWQNHILPPPAPQLLPHSHFPVQPFPPHVNVITGLRDKVVHIDRGVITNIEDKVVQFDGTAEAEALPPEPGSRSGLRSGGRKGKIKQLD